MSGSGTDEMITQRRISVGESSLRLLEAGPEDARPLLFLHGWPESADAWRGLMERAASDGCRALAVDLPGIGGSTGATDGTTRTLADLLAELITELIPEPGRDDLTVVGHDFGGMITYPLLRRHPDLVGRAVIMDVVVPGVPPWEQVLANPYLWHFAFHAIPHLPEALVHGRERIYFDFFYDALAPEQGSGVDDTARVTYVAAYATESALHAGFSWYRGLAQDATANQADATGPDGTVIRLDTPVLYLRGEFEQGDLGDYLDGFAGVGLTDVRGEVVPGAGHFAAEDNPDGVWRLISGFLTDGPVSADEGSSDRSW